MYFNTAVSIPDVKGKITIKSNKYVEYEVGREYKKDKKYNVPVRVTIGVKIDDDTMRPNENFIKYFPESEIEEVNDTPRSSCLKVGNYAVIKKIIHDYELDELISSVFHEKADLLLDLVAYSIIEESNVAMYYPDYAYDHVLFDKNKTIYSDSKISTFLNSISDDERILFLNAWCSMQNNKDSIYISYDSTNKNCQALDVDIAEYGHAKDDESKPVINVAVGYDMNNEIPLFYEEYPGSIVDISELDFMIDKAVGMGYKDIGFILDRGYFSKNNLMHLDSKGYSFIIACKGTAKFINKFVKEVKGTFENDRSNRINKYSVYGTTIVRSLFSDDTDRYIHVYYNEIKAAIERENIETKIERMDSLLSKSIGTKKDYSSFGNFFNIHYDKSGILTDYYPKNKKIDEIKEYCGYIVIVSSKKITAKEAIYLYKSRDVSEKLFRSDKSFLGGSAYRVQSVESIRAKTLISFIALIVRNKMYSCLDSYRYENHLKDNYFNVPATIKELNKIEMIKLNDKRYRLDHALTATQKKILSAFGLNANDMLREVEKVSKRLYKNDSI